MKLLTGAGRLSHRKVSTDSKLGMKPSWLELEYVDVRSDSRTSWLVVTLNCNGRLISGKSPAIGQRDARHGIHRATLATLNALELFSDHALSCELVDVAAVATRAQSSILVRLRFHSTGESVELFGSAPVVGDFAEAAALAVLDAANLYVHSLVGEA